MFNGPKEVKIKRIPRAGYFGITAFPGTTTGLGAELSKKGHNTGLTSEEEEYFEEKLKLPKGTLNPHNNWWDNVFNIEHKINLFNTKTTTLTLDNPLSQLKYKVLLASSKIANSEIEKANPLADFFIEDIEAKAKKENETFDYKMNAYETLVRLTPEEKRASLRLFGRQGVDSLSESVIKSELAKEIDKDPKLFVDLLSDTKLKSRLLVEELLDYKVITRKGNSFVNGDDIIASSTDECVDFFEDIKNQSTVLALTTRLKKAKKG